MDEISLNTIAFVLMALSLPLVSYGTTAGVTALWIGGVTALALGALVPPMLRYAEGVPDPA